MLLKVESDLKEAILRLPQKEKEKLLLRLIRKDKVLINQLHFQLLEDEDDLEKRREKTLNLIDSTFEEIQDSLKKKRFRSQTLIAYLKVISGYANEHLLFTKDKIGDIDLRLHILSNLFDSANAFFQYGQFDNEKLLIYTAGRIKNVFASFNKLHEDLQYDYSSRINEILKFAYSSELDAYLKNIGIPWEV